MARNLFIREHSTEVPISIPDETPHACLGGWVFLGFEGEDEHGEPVEVIERLACRHCRPEDL
jgi:hypothetical protein